MTTQAQQLVQPPPLPIIRLKEFKDVEDYLGSLWSYLDLLRQQMIRDQITIQEGSVTYDPPNLVDGAGTTTTVTVTGAALGDVAVASFSLSLQGITLTAYVSAADTVSVRFQNESGGAVDLASGTLRAGSFRWKIV